MQHWERADEPRKAHVSAFPQFRLEDRFVEFSTGQERQDDRTCSCEECDPLWVTEQPTLGEEYAHDKLGNRADHSLGKRGGDPKPNRE